MALPHGWRHFLHIALMENATYKNTNKAAHR